MSIIHPLNTNITSPCVFNNPFYYQADELCKLAQGEVLAYLKNRDDFATEINRGKMFGVLIVERGEGYAFLSAYSGQILGREDHEYFVPAVFDYLDEDGFFKIHEREISIINRKISELEDSADLSNLKIGLQMLQKMRDAEVSDYQNFVKSEKDRRENLRKNSNLSEPENQQLIKESQFQKAELKRLKDFYKQKISEYENELNEINSEIQNLKTERKQKSDYLQNWLFSKFEILNYKGEKKNLIEIFRDFNGTIPPAGSGECCAPKLLQYAFAHNLKPISIAEFWYGESPKGEIRNHLNFYPACNGKCKPILDFMLRGLSVAENPLIISERQELKTVYEDDFLIVVNKPAGMLAVPGKSDRESVYSIVKQRFPENDELIVCHRLDMATSGLMILAKTKNIFVEIQKQFEQHSIKKTYLAILDGEISTQNEGIISLPLMPDLNDRPRQIVDFQHGKPAVSDYKILKIENGKTLIEYHPKTGRTHQLRVHSAHKDGLNTPILGDELYGKKSDRMYLHAMRITFFHPGIGKEITLEAEVDW